MSNTTPSPAVRGRKARVEELGVSVCGGPLVDRGEAAPKPLLLCVDVAGAWGEKELALPVVVSTVSASGDAPPSLEVVTCRTDKARSEGG